MENDNKLSKNMDDTLENNIKSIKNKLNTTDDSIEKNVFTKDDFNDSNSNLKKLIDDISIEANKETSKKSNIIKNNINLSKIKNIELDILNDTDCVNLEDDNKFQRVDSIGVTQETIELATPNTPKNINDFNIIIDTPTINPSHIITTEEIPKIKTINNIETPKKDFIDSKKILTENSIEDKKNNTKSENGFVLELDDNILDIKDLSKKQHSPAKRKKKVKLKGVKLVLRLVVILAIIGIAIGLALGILFSINEVLGEGREAKILLFEVDKGSTVPDIAKKLETDGVIQSSMLFELYFKFMKYDNNIQFGFHELNGNMSYGEILNQLSQFTKSNETVKVTFPEGFTLNKMAKRLEANGVCTAKDFLHSFNQIDYKTDVEKEISDNELKYFKKEGFAFPDTYSFYKDEAPANVASKIINNFNNKITAEMYARMNELNMTLEETMIIASIVQAEAGESDEMKKVASVYINRLNNKGVFPNLQADPTRGYAREIKNLMDIANQEILDAYNTYEGAGLPPGPICNPGIDAITATLYPDETPYYFFCTNLKTREFFYAVTLKEHEQNLWRAGLV